MNYMRNSIQITRNGSVSQQVNGSEGLMTSLNTAAVSTVDQLQAWQLRKIIELLSEIDPYAVLYVEPGLWISIQSAKVTPENFAVAKVWLEQYTGCTWTFTHYIREGILIYHAETVRK